MVDNEKIRLMTQIALCEKKEKKKALVVRRYYKNDYIRLHLIKAFILFTILYVIIAAMCLVYNGQNFVIQPDYNIVFDLFKSVCIYYVFFLIVFLACAYLTYWIYYIRSKKIVKQYCQNLESLNNWYLKDTECTENKEIIKDD